MTPRFTNPHFLPQLIKTATRAEIYAEDPNEVHFAPDGDPVRVEHLNQLIQRSVRYELRQDHNSENPRGGKRRRLDVQSHDTSDTEVEEKVLFRLVSSAPPMPISLLPAPSPPSLFREPDIEDSKAQAAVRRQRARAVSIDGEAILRESTVFQRSRSSSKKDLELRTSIRDPNQCIMVVQTLQHPRKTRPPVPVSNLTRYPYVCDATNLPSGHHISEKVHCLVVDAERVDSPNSIPRRSRRRKAILFSEGRPPPQFWRPSPNMTGKFMGYAYGYPVRRTRKY